MGARAALVHAGVNDDLLDTRPIEINSFRLTSRRAVAVGRPTPDQWQATILFAAACQEGSAYWIGDLLNYADGRQDWRDKLDQIKSVTTLAEGTLHNQASVARRVGPEARALAQSHSHAEEVAALDPGEQLAWLDKSKTEGWTKRELRQAIQSASRRRVLDGTADSVYTVDVTVEVTVTAQNPTQAQDAAWTLVRDGGAGAPRSTWRVISAKARG